MNNNIIKLDSYSVLIVSKYFNSIQDYINIICVCKKFKETTEKLRFNPIPIKSLGLFPKLQTQYLYSEQDTKIEGIDRYEIWYKVNYEMYLQLINDSTRCHTITYTKEDAKIFGDSIPNEVNFIEKKCYSFSKIKEVTIPNHVTSLGNCSFAWCTNLESITFPSTLKELNSGCCNYCFSLTSIHIPSTIQSIGSFNFYDCSRMNQFNIPTSVTSIGQSCFFSCTSIQSITLPQTLIILETGLFESCSLLSTIKLPTGLVSIKNNCFSKCKKLTSIELPSSLRYIGKKCFSKCGIKLIQIPKSIKLIGVDCFLKCTSLTHLKFESKTTEFTFKVSYNDSLLYKKFGVNCSNVILTKNDFKLHINEVEQKTSKIHEFIIPNGIVEIGDNTFSYNLNIQSITIPTTVTSIGKYCFKYCSSLTTLTIPTTVTKINKKCFDCCNLKQLTLPLNENNKYPFKVSYNAYSILKQCNIVCDTILFYYFDHEKNNSIPKDIPLIMNIHSSQSDTEILSNCTSLRKNHLSKDITSIVIPTTVTYLCNGCFKGYSKLKCITLPTNVKYGKHIIDDCISLTKLNYEGDWNNIVVSYNDYLRYKSIGLVFNSIEYTKSDKKKYGNVIPSIVHSLHQSYYNKSNDLFYIPTHITSLDNDMFVSHKNHLKLQNISIPTSITTIPKRCFSKCYLLTSIELPSTLTSIKNKAFLNCISLQLITIPLSVTLIEQYAFKNCYSLTSITLLPSVMLENNCFKGCTQLKDVLNIPDQYF
ncbi:hypothetical protein QTN25_002192 [Entamoeba marina]